MLLSSREFSNKLERTLAASSERVIVLSAFIKSHALLWLLGKTQVRDISVVARWQPHDLACGASDIECFNLCRERGIAFGVSLNLHGKVYCIDEHILVGSANLTSKGMALSNRHNSEFGIGFIGGVADQTKIDKWLRQVAWLDEELVMSMQLELDNFDKNLRSDSNEWPAFILNKLAAPIANLWVHELPFNVPEALLERASDDDSHRHDLTLLNINPREVELERLLVARGGPTFSTSLQPD